MSDPDKKGKRWTVRVFDTFSRDDYEETFATEGRAMQFASEKGGTMQQAVVYAPDGRQIKTYGTY